MKVTISASQALAVDVIDDEIKTAMFSMGDDKAPGLDGYTACLFKYCWSIVKLDCLVAAKS